MGDVLEASLPSRERGLKYYGCMHYDSARMVAPLAGAWIEIAEYGLDVIG